MRTRIVRCAALTASAICTVTVMTGCALFERRMEHNVKTEVSFSWWGKDARNEYTLDGLKAYQNSNKNVVVRPEYADFDGYAVHGDFYPEGECKLAVLSHLDTVPAGEGWSYPPFKLTKADGKLFGRGTIDDKGPSVAVLWAVKAIKELNIPIKKNFRVIFGGNEEGGCEDMEYYESKQPFPEMVFTPDGSFPVLNCEKGMVHLTFSAEFSDDKIAEIKGGSVINAIPDK